MDALAENLSKVHWGMWVMAGLMICVCAVPFVGLYSDLWRLHSKEEE